VASCWAAWPCFGGVAHRPPHPLPIRQRPDRAGRSCPLTRPSSDQRTAEIMNESLPFPCRRC
jgi:hypothetical protein